MALGAGGRSWGPLGTVAGKVLIWRRERLTLRIPAYRERC